MVLAINDEENIICIKKPTNLLDVPKISEPDDLCGYYVPTDEQVKFYFDALLDDEIRITVVNGYKTDLDMSRIKCGYCNEKCASDVYYYCYECHLNICDLCVNLNNIQDPDGIKCKSHSNNNSYVIKRNKSHYQIFTCDFCKKFITDETRYSNNNENDICMACSEKYINNISDDVNLVTNHLFKVKNDFYEFGSMLDWVPILFDDVGNHIFYNYNKESKYKSRLAIMSMNNDGKCGYYILPSGVNINHILKRLEQLYNDKEWQDLDEETKIYNYPIKRIMCSLNMPINYV